MFEEALASVSLKFGADFQLKARQKDALKHIWAWDDTDKQDLIVKGKDNPRLNYSWKNRL